MWKWMDEWMTQSLMKLLQTVREKKILPVLVPEEFIRQVKHVNQVHLAKGAGRDPFPHTHNEDIAQW